MKFRNIRVYNFTNAIRGMRNPLNSWDKSDTVEGIISIYDFDDIAKTHLKKWGNDKPTQGDIIGALNDMIMYSDGVNAMYVSIGPNDIQLMQKLIAAGPEHRKFMRQIFVTVDITAPLYWWKEFDTYKVGTIANSTSTMHKLASVPITKDCFEMDDLNEDAVMYQQEPYNFDMYIPEYWDMLINDLEYLRKKYNETKDKRYWKELIRLLPESWLQTRTVTLNYENLLSIFNQRKAHKLNEWSGQENPQLPNFIKFIMQLPYAQYLLVN